MSQKQGFPGPEEQKKLNNEIGRKVADFYGELIKEHKLNRQNAISACWCANYDMMTKAREIE